MVIVLMGVSGSGKTTIGERLSRLLGWPFFDGDSFHPEANIRKMTAGTPLDDADRKEWLKRIRVRMDELRASGADAIIACSALKKSYRDVLAGGSDEVAFVYLHGDYELIKQRLDGRSGHFMRSVLLSSQFTALQEPEQALTVEINQSPEAIVAEIRHRLQL